MSSTTDQAVQQFNQELQAQEGADGGQAQQRVIEPLLDYSAETASKTQNVASRHIVLSSIKQRSQNGQQFLTLQKPFDPQLTAFLEKSGYKVTNCRYIAVIEWE